MENIRKRAEAMLKEGPEGQNAFSGEEVRRLIHELRVHQIELELQNEELRAAQLEISALHEKYVDLYDFAPMGYLTIDAKGLISQANLTCAAMLGAARSQLIHLSLANFIAKEDQDIYYAYHRRTCDAKAPQSCEIRMRKKDGVQFHAHLTCAPVLDENGRIIEVRLTVDDITLLKRAEDQIKAALGEKEVLLQELYHRTNNNLQTIRLLFKFQTGYFKDARLQKICRDMDGRISAIALAHQQLYQSQNLSNINLHDYIHNLVVLLMKSCEVSPDRISFVLNVENIPAAIDMAIPCGLLVNELITNSFKHAFPEDRKGQVVIGLFRDAEGKIVLSVSDNGVGVPEGFDPMRQETLGLRTIIAIAEYQLQGEVSFETTGGMTCRIRFNDRKQNPASAGNA